MADTTTYTLLADDRLWLVFHTLKRRDPGFRIGSFCERAVREALPQPDSGLPHSLGEIYENRPATSRTRAFRGDGAIRPLLEFWQERLGIQRQILIATAIRRKQEREGMVPGPRSRA